MTRDNLVDLIYHDVDDWSCPSGNCCKNKECRDCASNMLAEYENEIYNKALDDFMQLVKEHDFKVRGVDTTSAVTDMIEFLVKEVKKGKNNG